MKRRELREHIFQLLFRVEFNGQDEMEEQVSLYVDDMKEEEIVEPKDETYIEEKYKKIVEKLPRDRRAAGEVFQRLEAVPYEQGGSDDPSSGRIRDEI